MFSIGPALPKVSSATYHHGARQRRRLDETHWQRPSRPTVAHEGYRDDRKRLPSYRDTASEIISLYGSDTQRSYSRSFSPSIDDSRRSYSLTTCSSQPLPSHKSFATLQSHPGVSESDRSRSPFPYPTRLKRPGLRTSSPFVAEAEGCGRSKTDRSDRPSQVSFKLTTSVPWLIFKESEKRVLQTKSTIWFARISPHGTSLGSFKRIHQLAICPAPDSEGLGGLDAKITRDVADVFE